MGWNLLVCSDLTFGPSFKIAKISVYILLIRIPRGLQCHTQLIGNHGLRIF